MSANVVAGLSRFMSANVVAGLSRPPFGGEYILMLSVLGSFLISGVLIGLLMFRPVLLAFPIVGDLENSDFTLEVRFLEPEPEPRRRKSVRRALFSGWYMGSETVAATLPKSLLE